MKEMGESKSTPTKTRRGEPMLHILYAYMILYASRHINHIPSRLLPFEDFSLGLVLAEIDKIIGNLGLGITWDVRNGGQQDYVNVLVKVRSASTKTTRQIIKKSILTHSDGLTGILGVSRRHDGWIECGQGIVPQIKQVADFCLGNGRGDINTFGHDTGMVM